jgi:branched-chain amino acid aminotransferase
MNSQLIHMEAEINGYAEGIGLDVNGLVSEGSGENIFIVRNGVIYTPPLSNSALSGITRDSVLTIARHLGMTVKERSLPRELLYIADEVFFTGTAAEVSPIRSIDRILIGDGKSGVPGDGSSSLGWKSGVPCDASSLQGWKPGEITKKIADEFFGIANGLKPDRFGWLTPVKVNATEPVGE